MAILIGDFYDLDAQSAGQIRRLAVHNDIVVVHVYDALECALPEPGVYTVTDGQRELSIDSGDTQRRAAYAARFQQRRVRLQSLADGQNIHLLECRTDDDPLTVLQARFGR